MQSTSPSSRSFLELPVIKSVILNKDRFWAMADLTGTSTRRTACYSPVANGKIT